MMCPRHRDLPTDPFAGTYRAYSVPTLYTRGTEYDGRFGWLEIPGSLAAHGLLLPHLLPCADSMCVHVRHGRGEDYYEYS